MKTLTKEIPFGKVIARVTVNAWIENTNLDGFVTGSEILTSSKVEIVVNGKVAESGHFATVIGFHKGTESFYAKAKLDTTKKYTRVGDKAITLGEESGKAINKAIADMKEELENDFQVKSNETIKAEKEEIEEIALAKEVVELAEKEGIENLMSAADIKVWRKKYNDLNNEGGEGYIPTRISKEEYERCKNLLESYGGEK